MDSSNMLKQLQKEAEIGRAVMDIIAKLKAKYTVKRSGSLPKAVTPRKKVASKKVSKASIAPVPPAA